MISRTFNTRTPNSSFPNWKVRYLPARASACAAAVSFMTAVGGIVSPLASATSDVQRAGVRGRMNHRVSHSLVAGQAELDQQTLVVPVEPHHNPIAVSAGAGLEIA